VSGKKEGQGKVFSSHPPGRKKGGTSVLSYAFSSAIFRTERQEGKKKERDLASFFISGLACEGDERGKGVLFALSVFWMCPDEGKKKRGVV